MRLKNKVIIYKVCFGFLMALFFMLLKPKQRGIIIYACLGNVRPKRRGQVNFAYSLKLLF